MTEEDRRVTIFGWRSIDASVKWLGTLILFTTLPGCLGLTISRSLNCARETEVTTKHGISKINLEFVLEEEVSLGVVLSLSAPLTFSVVR